MKKLLLVLSLLMPASVYAEGPYDGAWNTPVDSFVCIYQKGNELLAIILDKDFNGWLPLFGTIADNTATLQSAAGPVALNVRVTFMSGNLATVTIVSCAPASECDIPNGSQFNITEMLQEHHQALSACITRCAARQSSRSAAGAS